MNFGEEAVRGGDELAELEVGGAEILEGFAHERGTDVAPAGELAGDADDGVADEDVGGGDQAADSGEADGDGAVAAHEGEGSQSDQESGDER